ncbi:TATA-box-binding protein [Candidatus Lokiarchaeum ossiferum]|uniref:TATA-box-binding protein n=1 Tax=Candidatus Lokiarchaeum ossiferum TaxID=2951803 RepID=A0ABY6I1D3_9ARCH|nr:TATA-box-binding protein [Candidatus Lokiarchaeum sp. B-35]
MPETINVENKRHSATYSIQNIVVSVELNRDINLKSICEAYKDAEENLNKFPGICLRLKKPKCAILLFSNGKMVITGLKLSKDAPVVINRVIDRLNAIGIEIVDDPEWRLVNLVLSLNFRQSIPLDEAALLLSHSIYEPEVFPGLIFRIQEPKAVFLIFSSGKVVLTGLKAESQILPAIKLLGKTLKENGLLN